MTQNGSNAKFMNALIATPEGQRLDRKVYTAIEKLDKGKRLKSHEFLEIHAVLFKPGPCIKFNSPAKWERISREFSARNLIIQ
jgi:hypothetical protein